MFLLLVFFFLLKKFWSVAPQIHISYYYSPACFHTHCIEPTKILVYLLPSGFFQSLRFFYILYKEVTSWFVILAWQALTLLQSKTLYTVGKLKLTDSVCICGRINFKGPNLHVCKVLCGQRDFPEPVCSQIGYCLVSVLRWIFTLIRKWHLPCTQKHVPLRWRSWQRPHELQRWWPRFPCCQSLLRGVICCLLLLRVKWAVLKEQSSDLIV